MKIKSNSSLLELLVLSVLGTIVAIWNKVFLCQLSIGLGFDQQSLLFWDYTKSLGLTPYSEFFYPYGLLFYFKIDSIFWNITSILIVFTVLLFVFKIFKSIFKDHLFTYLSFFSYCIFVSIFFDFDSFVRYSAIIPLLYLFSQSTFKEKFFELKNGLIHGFLIGILFFLIHDIAVYCIFIFAFFFFYNLIFVYKKIDVYLFKFILSFILGSLFGLTPLIIFLQSNNAFYGYIENYELLNKVSLFAKTPFPSSLKSVENLFNMLLIIVSVLFLIKKKDKRFIYFLVLSLVLTILLYEYKNIIRTSHESITIVGLLLFLVLFTEIIIFLKNKKINSVLIASAFITVFFMFINAVYLDRNINKAVYASVTSGKRCVNSKISATNKQELGSYFKIKEYLSDKNVKVFSFPGDSVFYILFNQIPPHYPSVYESTPLFAQKKQIDYIKNNNVNFVILNVKSSAIQDGVPDKIRNKTLFEYIEKNYKEDKRIDNFIILKKK